VQQHEAGVTQGSMDVQKLWNQVRDIVCHYLGELRDE
jgi:hypothetical protein